MGNKHRYNDVLGYIRIDGPDIERGSVDLQSVKHTVDGTDKVLRHFLAKYDSSIKEHSEVNFPIEIRQGCWEILIPTGAAITFFVGRPLSAYLTEASKDLAKNDVGSKTTKEVFLSAIKSAQNAIKIAKHLGTMKHRHDLDAKVTNADHIVIKNSRGQELVITKKALDDYQSTPKDLFADISYPAVNDRSVNIGYVEQGKQVEQSILSGDRDIFYPSEDDKEELFPELKHGETVDIEGVVTKGNQRTNLIGFEYKGHVLTCSPVNSYVSNYLQAHYKRCMMHGIVSRLNEDGEEAAKPRVYFTSLDVIETDDDESQQQLL